MIINANAIRIPLADESVQMCVTSPPYYGLRDYQVGNQIGLEQTPQEFIDNIVSVFDEVMRVLKPDGIVFFNIGDSYAGSGKGSRGTKAASGKQKTNKGANYTDKYKVEGFDTNKSKRIERGAGRWGGGDVPVEGLPGKNLMMIPARCAIALQAAGWYLRAEIVWAKPNPMPESVTDRPTRSHEMIYLLSKSARYFYDCEAVREVASYPNDDRRGRASEDHKYMSEKMVSGIYPRKNGGAFSRNYAEAQPAHGAMTLERPPDTGYRNQRDVWNITPEPYSGAHFATFPTEIPRRAIKAGSRPGDIVLDPFCGSGTTGIVCRELGRRFVGLDLSMEYLREFGLPRAELKHTRESLERLPLFAPHPASADAPQP